jgi:hypothetical protein
MDLSSAESEDEMHSDTSSDGDFFEESVMNVLQNFAAACHAAAGAFELVFTNTNQLLEDYSVNATLPKAPRLENLVNAHASVFRRWSGFTLTEWELLSQRVCPTIVQYARGGHLKRGVGRKTKLTPAERLLSFVLYVKHNSGAGSNAIDWNYSRTSLNSDGVFIASAINKALADEIQWPNARRRAELAKVLPEFEGCIGFVDGTLCTIRRPRIDQHKKFYNNRRAKYCMNSVVIVDHDGLIIYVDSGYPGSFHDVRCLKMSHIHSHWREYFSAQSLDDVGEYLLGDPGYLGADMYVLRRVDFREVAWEDQNPVISAFNRRHSHRKIKVEWGIGGVKNKWRRFLDVCPSRRRNFEAVFDACCRLTNFIHRSRQDFSVVDLGEADDQNSGDWGYGETDDVTAT